MNFSSDELKNVAFRKAVFGGYDKSQVDTILDKIVEDYHHNRIETSELEHKIQVLDEKVKHYQSVEEAMQRCLVIAQRTSEEIKANAAEEAEKAVKSAAASAQKLVEDANQEVGKIKSSYEETKRELSSFKNRTEALLNSQLDVLKQLPDA